MIAPRFAAMMLAALLWRAAAEAPSQAELDAAVRSVRASAEHLAGPLGGPYFDFDSVRLGLGGWAKAQRYVTLCPLVQALTPRGFLYLDRLYTDAELERERRAAQADRPPLPEEISSAIAAHRQRTLRRLELRQQALGRLIEEARATDPRGAFIPVPGSDFQIPDPPCAPQRRVDPFGR